MGSKYNTRQRMKSPYVSVSDSFVLDISVSKAVATSAPKNATLEGTLLYKFPTTVVKESFEATWDSDKQHYDVVSSSISATISDSEKIKVTYDGEVYTLYNDSSESHLELDEDLVIWYFGPTKISNLSTPTATRPFIDTYSTYRVMYSADDNSEAPVALTAANQGVTQLVNSAINFSETYIEDGGGIEGYSVFTINIGYKSVSGTTYGLANTEGLWPPNAIVLGTIPNLGVFVGSASADNNLLPYKFIRFNTYTNGWRRVHLSVNEIGSTDPIPADLADPQYIAEL